VSSFVPWRESISQNLAETVVVKETVSLMNVRGVDPVTSSHCARVLPPVMEQSRRRLELGSLLDGSGIEREMGLWNFRRRGSTVTIGETLNLQPCFVIRAVGMGCAYKNHYNQSLGKRIRNAQPTNRKSSGLSSIISMDFWYFLGSGNLHQLLQK